MTLFLNIEMAAKEWGWSRRNMTRMIEKYQVPVKMFGRKWFVMRADLERLMPKRG